MPTGPAPSRGAGPGFSLCARLSCPAVSVRSTVAIGTGGTYDSARQAPRRLPVVLAAALTGVPPWPAPAAAGAATGRQERRAGRARRACARPSGPPTAARVAPRSSCHDRHGASGSPPWPRRPGLGRRRHRRPDHHVHRRHDGRDRCASSAPRPWRPATCPTPTTRTWATTFAEKADGKHWIKYDLRRARSPGGGRRRARRTRCSNTTRAQSVKLLLASGDVQQVGAETVERRRPRTTRAPSRWSDRRRPRSCTEEQLRAAESRASPPRPSTSGSTTTEPAGQEGRAGRTTTGELTRPRTTGTTAPRSPYETPPAGDRRLQESCRSKDRLPRPDGGSARRERICSAGRGRVLSYRSQRPLVVAVPRKRARWPKDPLNCGRPAQVTVEELPDLLRSGRATPRAPAPGRFVLSSPF